MKREVLESLHEALTSELLARIQDGRATPADLSVARALLKDNSIDCVAVPESPLAKLALSLPFDDDAMEPMRNKFGTG